MEYKTVNTVYTFEEDYIVKETTIIITERINKSSYNLKEMAICLSAGLPYRNMEPLEEAYEEVKDELLFK